MQAGKHLKGLFGTMLFKESPATKPGACFDTKDGFIRMTKEGVQKAFANDLPPSWRNIIYALQTPASEKVFGVTPGYNKKPYCSSAYSPLLTGFSEGKV